MEKVFNNYKGVLLFYADILILAFLCVIRINTLNSIANNESNQSYYAYNQ
jgi:hypothetical protein